MSVSEPSSPSGLSIAGGSFSEDAAATAFSLERLDNAKLVFDIDIFLLAVIGAFVLCSMPRAFARFTRAVEWRHGHILRSLPVDTRKTRRPRREQEMQVHNTHGAGPSSLSVGNVLSSEDSHTLYSHTGLTHYVREDGTISGRSPFPPHIREWSTIMYPVAPIFRHRVDLGFSIGQCMILGGYFGALLYASLVKSNIFKDPLRTGFVAMSQIPFVYAFAAKNNLLGMLLGVGYEKLNYLHRFAGQLITIASNVHAIGYIYEWTAAGTFTEEISKPNIAWGFVALVCLDVLLLLSTSYWRHKLHNIFFRSHVVGFILFLPAACFHGPVIVAYVIAAAGLFGFDILLRVFKTRFCHARILPLPTLSMTRIEVPELNGGWRAGQHVRLRVLSTGMGWLGWAEAHPFTIASVCKGHEGLVLMCKKAGGWTENLYEVAKKAGYGERESGTGHVRVMIEGPYGGPGHTVFASYSAAIFVVGGSGISFALSAVQELVQKDLEGTSRIKAIELIWSVQDPASLTPLIPLFASLLQQTVSPLRISVFYTRANTSTFPSKDAFPPGLTLTTGRPKLGKVLDSIITKCVSLGSGIKDSEDITGVMVGVCGPVGLGDDVAKAVGKVDARRRQAVGGIELHEEVFGW